MAKALVDTGATTGVVRVLRDEDDLSPATNLGGQTEDPLRALRDLMVICFKDTPHSK